MFYWRIGTLLDAFRAHEPALALGAGRIADAVGTAEYDAVVREVFDTWPSISIDYAVMEKAHNVAGVAAEFPWDDIGTWTALARSHHVDAHGNFVKGCALLVETENSIVYNQVRTEVRAHAVMVRTEVCAHAVGADADAQAAGPKERNRPLLVATLGVRDLIVVTTADAVLVCPREREQDVKRLLAALREEGHDEYL